VAERVAKMQEAESEYAARVSGITPLAEGVSEEEFTKARRESQGAQCVKIGATTYGMLGTPPAVMVQEVKSHAELLKDFPIEGSDADTRDKLMMQIAKLKNLLADQRHRTSCLRSKNERLGRRCQELHAELRQMRLAREMDEIEEAAKLDYPPAGDDDLALTRIGGTA
jgi:hypothetical protein